MKIEIIFGIHSISSALENYSKYFKQVYLIKSYLSNKRLKSIFQLICHYKIPIKLVNKKYLDIYSKKNVHQGIIAKIFRKKSIHLECFIKKNKNPFLLVLDRIKDPYNLGACIRTANAAGIDAVIITKDHSAKLNSVAKKVSCGASERIPVITVTNLASTLRTFQNMQITIIGTDHKSSNNFFKEKITNSLALVIGSEEKGLRKLTRKYCNRIVSIPMKGYVNSLNVSVATGIFLFEILRKRNLLI